VLVFEWFQSWQQADDERLFAESPEFASRGCAHLAAGEYAADGVRHDGAHVRDFSEHPLGVPRTLPRAVPLRRAHA